MHIQVTRLNLFKKQHFATVAKPQTRLVGGDNTWVWSTEEQTAFQRLKYGFVSAPVLGYPNPKL